MNDHMNELNKKNEQLDMLLNQKIQEEQIIKSELMEKS